MMARTLAAVAREVQGTLLGADRAFGAVTTDTRALGPGRDSRGPLRRQ
jgi:UDP-N-acetylmuramyl pentapeptide synthase